jgi:membrane-bound lytic murein transglycosylase A
MVAALQRPSARPAPASAAAPAANGYGIDYAPTTAGAATGIQDPSYVFFRRIPDGPQGPTGALGVPLTAGRSIAVDPRTTPLGYPVFLAVGGNDGRTPATNRLMFAQDTGGAIRGPVRADFFFGFGQQAGAQASSMNDTGRMWLLIPRGLEVAELNPATRTRALGGTSSAECVIPDPQFCVEE